MIPAPPVPLDMIFAALADPTRRAILTMLLEDDMAVTDVAEPFAMSQPAISKHLKVLEHAGLISRSRDAQRRPCKIELAPLKEVSDWVEVYRQLWEQRFDRLDDYLKQLQDKETKNG